MGRVYGEPVEVELTDDGQPARFTWRGRAYTVLSVLEYWLVNRDWWRESSPVPARPELQYWRVDALGGRSAGCYELRRDFAADRWTLRRVAD